MKSISLCSFPALLRGARGQCAALAVLAMALSLAGPVRAQDGAQSCDPAAIEQSTTPMRPYKSKFINYSRALADREPKDADVILLGDSLVQGWDAAGLAAEIAPKTVLNLGVGGDRTQQVIWRLEQMDLGAYQPETVVLMIGTNNLGDGEPACGIAAGIETIVDMMRAQWPEVQVLFIQIPPRGINFAKYMPERTDVSALVKEALGDAVSVLDLDIGLSCGITEFPESYMEARSCGPTPPAPCENYRSDLLHFEAPGYEVLNGVIKALLAQR